MEALTVGTFKVLLFIIPGIISLRILTALKISSPSNPFNTTIDGLILTLIDHALYGAVRWLVANFPSNDWVRSLVSFGSAIGQSASIPGELGRQFVDSGGFGIIIIAVGVGFVAGAIRYHGWDFRLLRWLRVSNRTGESLVWSEVLTKEPPSYAVVACKDGSRFMGWIATFSEEAGNYEVFLKDASQVQTDGTRLPIPGPGVLLTRENPIIRVELWNSQ